MAANGVHHYHVSKQADESSLVESVVSNCCSDVSAESKGEGDDPRCEFARSWLEGIAEAARTKLQKVRESIAMSASDAPNGHIMTDDLEDELPSTEELVIGQTFNVSTEKNRCRCHLRITKCLQNRYGTLHGGVIAMLVDVVGTAAILTVADPPGGVSIDINVSYIAASRVGETIEVEGVVLRSGRTISVVEVNLRRIATKELLAQGRHTKFLAINSGRFTKL